MNYKSINNSTKKMKGKTEIAEKNQITRTRARVTRYCKGKNVKKMLALWDRLLGVMFTKMCFFSVWIWTVGFTQKGIIKKNVKKRMTAFWLSYTFIKNICCQHTILTTNSCLCTDFFSFVRCYQ